MIKHWMLEPRIISEREIVSKLIHCKSIEKYTIAIVLALIVAGCGTTSQKISRPPAVIELGSTQYSAEHYLNLAQRSALAQKQSYLLQAARAYLGQNQPAKAKALLDSISLSSLPNDDHRLELQLLKSKVLTSAGDIDGAINALTPSGQWQVSSQRWQQFYQLRSNLELRNDQMTDAAQSLMTLSQHLTAPALLVDNQTAIWQLLTPIPQDLLKEARADAITQPVKGWYALAIAAQQSAMSPNDLQRAITQWTLDFPTHPAIANLPQELVDAVNVLPYAPRKIALLLPLSGRYEKLGVAVQNGLISNLLTQDDAPQLIIFDTQDLGAQQAYNQAIENGAQFIVGPLLKANVEIVSQLMTDIPVLLLNKPTTSHIGNRHYSFSLDKESEAIQGSEYIYHSGKKFPAIIAPNNANGHRIANLFSQHWQSLTQEEGQPSDVEQFFFNNDKELKLTVEKMFETNQSQARINHIRLLVGNAMKSETRSRRDIDAVYLVANPSQTNMLKPSIDVTVSAFASEVPVYVGSTGNINHSSSRGTGDLNKLHVSELPWLLKLRDTKLSPAKAKALWPKLKQSQLRLFAMGHDAYQLIEYLAQMELFPQYKLEGFSGRLSLDHDHHINREMSWAQYQRGKLRPQR